MKLNQSCPSDSVEPLDQAVPEAKIPLLLKLITVPSSLFPPFFIPSFLFFLLSHSVLTEKNLNWYRKEDSPKQHIRLPLFLCSLKLSIPLTVTQKATEFSLISPKGQIMHLHALFPFQPKGEGAADVS